MRVLVPCYRESLAIIQRTVLAAKRADRPPGVRVAIYVCDDGADAKKRAWVAQLGDPEILYVTGRDRSLKSLNGKSANLNYCLQLLYPDVPDPEGGAGERLRIPANELMCLFDADQTCSRGFFQVRPLPPRAPSPAPALGAAAVRGRCPFRGGRPRCVREAYTWGLT